MFSQIFFISAFTIKLTNSNFHQSLSRQIPLLSLRRVSRTLRKVIDQSTYFQTSQNDGYFVKLSIKATVRI